MTSKELDNLVRIGALKRESGDQKEFDGLLKLGRTKLADATNSSLSAESQFDLAYNAAHSLALAAMRWHGYRPNQNRYVVFQALPHTLSLKSDVVRVLGKSHSERNLAEYEGITEIDTQLLSDLIAAAQLLLSEVEKIKPMPSRPSKL
jgi:hypothetical protein